MWVQGRFEESNSIYSCNWRFLEPVIPSSHLVFGIRYTGRFISCIEFTTLSKERILHR
jgi:hypothetical protein